MKTDHPFPFRRVNGDAGEAPKGRGQRTVLERIATQLQYYGYDVERKVPTHDDENPVYLLSHERKDRPKMRFSEPVPGIVIFAISYAPAVDKSPDAPDHFNQANIELFVLKAHYRTEENGHLHYTFEAVYAGDYSKRSFSHFFDTVQADLRTFFHMKDHDRIIRGIKDEPEQGADGEATDAGL